MIWNLITAGILLWLSKRYEKQLKPGTLFAGWLMAAGFGRTWLELFFRPDQPKIPGTIISYSAIVSVLMGIAGIVMLLIRYKQIQPAFAENWETEYTISNRLMETPQVEMEIVEEEPKAPPRVKRAVKKVPAASTAVKKTSTRKTVKKEEAPAPKKKPAARTKKSSLE
jgi:hypothetical protein